MSSILKRSFTNRNKLIQLILIGIFGCGIPGLFLLLFYLYRNDQSAVIRFTSGITTPLKAALGAISVRVPFSLAECVWTAFILGALIFVISFVVRILKSENKPQILIRFLAAVLSAALWLSAISTVLWGINYYADTYETVNSLQDRGCTAEELYTLLIAFADRAAAISVQVPADENGETVLNANDVLKSAPDAYAPVKNLFLGLNQPTYRPKAMLYSRIMSMLGFTGFYFAPTGESNVNVEQPDYLIPVTALHELSHQQQIASEEDCNFIAIIAGINSGNPVFEYSSCMFACIHLSNALLSADSELWRQAQSHFNSRMNADNLANNAYWAQFESTPVETVGNTVYENYLQGYEQTDGMRSYEKCVDLLAAYYFDYAPQEQFWN